LDCLDLPEGNQVLVEKLLFNKRGTPIGQANILSDYNSPHFQGELLIELHETLVQVSGCH
jgi:hypothetical protein